MRFRENLFGLWLFTGEYLCYNKNLTNPIFRFSDLRDHCPPMFRKESCIYGFKREKKARIFCPLR